MKTTPLNFVAATSGTRNSEYGNRTNFGSLTRISFKFSRSPSVPCLNWLNSQLTRTASELTCGASRLLLLVQSESFSIHIPAHTGTDQIKYLLIPTDTYTYLHIQTLIKYRIAFPSVMDHCWPWKTNMPALPDSSCNMLSGSPGYTGIMMPVVCMLNHDVCAYMCMYV